MCKFASLWSRLHTVPFQKEVYKSPVAVQVEDNLRFQISNGMNGIETGH